MKRLFKKSIATFLAVVMILLASPLSGFVGLDIDFGGLLDFTQKVSALDSTGKCGENVTYTFNSSTGLLTISGTGEMYDCRYVEGYHSSPFYNNSSIKTVVIESGVTSIGEYAFEDCTGLTSITIPDSVRSIGNRAFYDCTGLTSITIPDSVTSIGSSAFYGCTGLTSITIPDSVTSIGWRAFEDCTGLTSITIPDSVTSIDGGAFNNTGYYNNSSNWENDVLYINNHLIKAKDTLSGAYTIKAGTKTIAGGAFSGRKSLTSITIPDSVTSIVDYAFSGCTSLTSIIIPDSVTSIGWSAFSGCTGLTSITIPESVTTIGNCAFSFCDGLTSITIPDSVTSIGYSAFSGCTGLTSITIPDSVTSIGDSAFNGCTGLKSVIIGNSVISIGEHAFYNCTGLTSITIGNSVTSIGYSAFSYCDSLTSITIPDSVTSIASSAFSYCDSLKSVIIGNEVRSIGTYAFSGCTSLTSVTIGNSVTSIGYSAFSGCTGLKDVYYSGTEAQWNEIVIGKYNDDLLNANIHYNYKPDIHTHAFTHIVVPSTCSVAGMEYDICGDCGETKNSKTLPLAEHTWSSWVVTKQPTTTQEGVEQRECTLCHKKETRAIEKLKVISDENTGVQIEYGAEYDSGVQLEVKEEFDGKSIQLINTNYGQVNTAMFDITTTKDGVKVQPTGEVTVKIPVPAGFTSGKIFVVYVDSENGTTQTIPASVVDGFVVFKVSHFSKYAVCWENGAVKSVTLSDIKLNYKKSITLNPQITADDGASYTVSYSSSNPKVASVDENGNVKANKKGTAQITVTVTDTNGNTVTDTCNVKVNYNFGQWLLIILLFGWIWYI